MEISCTIDRLGRKRPKGRPSGSLLKNRFNPRNYPVFVAWNTGGSHGQGRTLKHSYEYLTQRKGPV